MSLNFTIVNTGKTSVDVDVIDEVRDSVITRGTFHPSEARNHSAAQNESGKILVKVVRVDSKRSKSFEWDENGPRFLFNLD